MGTYLNPGLNNFIEDKQRLHYIDKTLLIKELNNKIDIKDKFICSSRPRRFGKTMAANMIAAYYSKGCDSHEIFSDLKISTTPSFENHINKYNVIALDMNVIFRSKLKGCTTSESVDYFVIPELRKAFPNVNIPQIADLSFAIQSIYNETGEKFVIVIDEYDVLVREHADEEDLNAYIDMLIKLFKNSYLRPAIALAYITGILPIIRDSFQSKLNNFKEVTMLDARELAPYIGFTREETKLLANNANMDMAELERWYDGYCVDGVELYSPKSVIEAIERKKCGSYWTQTGSYEAVSNYIDLNIDGVKADVIKMMAGESIPVIVDKFRNKITDFKQKDEVFTYLIHLGYLAYNGENKTCRIPNTEIKSEWGWIIGLSKKYKKVGEITNLSKKLLEETYNLEGEEVAKSLEKSHELLTSNLSYNNEQSMQSAIMLSYFYAYDYYTILPEVTTGKGYADIVMVPFLPNIPALVIELKKDKVVGGAIEQIKEKDYPSRLSGYVGNTLLVGISYDSKTKKHTCIIERA